MVEIENYWFLPLLAINLIHENWKPLSISTFDRYIHVHIVVLVEIGKYFLIKTSISDTTFSFVHLKTLSHNCIFEYY